MRKYGDIGNVHFSNQGWNIYNLAFEYKLSYNGYTNFIYVTTMKELKEEIAKKIGEFHEED